MSWSNADWFAEVGLTRASRELREFRSHYYHGIVGIGKTIQELSSEEYHHLKAKSKDFFEQHPEKR